MAECFGRATAARTGSNWDRGLMGAMFSRLPKRRMGEWLLERATDYLCWAMVVMQERRVIRLRRPGERVGLHRRQSILRLRKVIQLLRWRMVLQRRPRMARRCRRERPRLPV